MSVQSGNLMLLKIYDQEKFNTIGGMRSNRMVLNNEVIDVTHKLSGEWRELLEGGLRSVSISGNGIFTDSEAEEKIKFLAFNNKKEDFQLFFGNGEILEGSFLITSYERTGNFSEEETYSITLESSGMLNWKRN